MQSEIKIPSMGESISEVTIGQIFSPTGSRVVIDAEILELETDKVNQVLYASQAGRIILNVKTGDRVPIGQVIGKIESVESTEKEAKPVLIPAGEVPPPTEVTPHIQPVERLSIAPSYTLRYTKEDFLSDLSASLLKEQQVVPPQEEPKVISPPPTKKEGPRETRRRLSTIRRVIAQRLIEAQHEMALLTTFNEVDLTHVIELREKYRESFSKKYGCKLGFMSFFIQATVSALQTFPVLNSYLDGEEIVHREYYDIGVAVGTEKGVIVPVLRDCDKRHFSELESALEHYAKQAREGTLAIEDLQGGGFTITNGGIYGSLLSTPIVNPPQCAILGMHKIEKRPVVIQDQIQIRSMMYLALSYDHRLIDGKEAVSFLVHIKAMLEDPSRLLLEI
jgi:2-oxoglutarate dehydrogenase E2 component (dihydrolipoamide succinyltransferase)